MQHDEAKGVQIMKYVILCMILVCSGACGRSDDSSAVTQDNAQDVANEAVAEAQEMVEQIKQGKSLEGTEGTEGCRIINAGLIEEFFATGDAEVTYRGSIPSKRAGHVVCFALWDKPDKEALEAANQQAMMEWAKGIASGNKKPQPKPVSGTNEVSLTLISDTFNTNEEAIASLEESVATLSKGITVEVAGKKHETKMEFGPWMDGVGEKAIWSAKGGLNFVYDARRYALKVSISDDDEQNRQAEISLAQRIIASL